MMHVMVLYNVREVTSKVVGMQCREELKTRWRINEGMKKRSPCKMSKPEQKFFSWKWLDSNIASVKVSREVCSFFVQVLLQDSRRGASSRMVMKGLGSCAVPCVGPAGKPAVPGKGGW